VSSSQLLLRLRRSKRFRRPGRKRSALDWAAIAVEEHGRELAQSFVDAAKRGDWRAAEALMSRIYGKPTENVVTHTPASPEKAVLTSMTLEEKLELLHSLRRGEALDHPVLEASSAGQGSSEAHELEL
jgi:hypothetical protein